MLKMKNLKAKSKSEESLEAKTQKTSTVDGDKTDINETQRSFDAQKSLADGSTQKDVEQ